MILAKQLAWIYLRIGAAFAAIAWGSFAFTLLFVATAPLADRLSALIAVQPAAVLTALLRLLFWLPSAVMWLMAPEQYTLLMWVAPGLYVGPASRFYAP